MNYRQLQQGLLLAIHIHFRNWLGWSTVLNLELMAIPSVLKSTVLRRLLERYPRFLSYLAIGGSAAVIDLLAFVVLFNFLGLSAIVSNIFSVSIATIESYTLNALYNFKIRNKLLFRFSSFVAITMLGMLLGSTLIYLLHNVQQIDGNLAKIAAMPPVVIIQFLLNKHISFRN